MTIPSENPAPVPPPDDPLAAQLRGFGPVGILAMGILLAGSAITPPLGALLVLAWAWRARLPWRELGYVRPRSWLGGLALGVVFGCAFKLFLKAVVMPLLGAAPINPAYHYLAGNTAAVPGFVLWLIVGAGFGEETVYRGYLFERLGKLLGTTRGAKAAIVLFTSLLFALAHYPVQGLAGAEQAMITGLVFGTIFALRGRLWTILCAHVAFDLMAYALIYWNLESAVAHLVFR